MSEWLRNVKVWIIRVREKEYAEMGLRVLGRNSGGAGAMALHRGIEAVGACGLAFLILCLHPDLDRPVGN